VKAMSPASLRQHVSILAMLAVMVSTVGCAKKTCKPMTCPQIPAKCTVVSARHKDFAGCLTTRCEVLKCEPDVYSRDWRGVGQKIFSIRDMDDQFREALREGLIISPEVKSFPVPQGSYVFLDPVTRNWVLYISLEIDTLQ
jgi:hypothetical protein